MTKIRKTADAAAAEPILVEVAWEVCQQLGGIYTVIRSKVPHMIERWGDRYSLLGPYDPRTSPTEFEEAEPSGPAPPERSPASPGRSPVGRAVLALRDQGFEARFGTWLISGRPQTVLLNPQSAMARLGDVKRAFWDHHHIGLPGQNGLVDAVLAFGHLVEQFFRALAAQTPGQPTVGHFHEWMAGTAIPEIRRANLPVAAVFTTHATSLGRYMAPNDPAFYDHLPQVNWQAEARRFGIEPQVQLERAAAHGAHVLTTVSDVTALECESLLGRRPDLLLPNGLNIERFVAMHEFQNLHLIYKEKINQFVMSHFFPSYTFDLDRTLYFFSSGRYEYRNKGFDLVLESLGRLRGRLRAAGLDRTIVFFLVTQRPFRSLNAEVLRYRALMEEMRDTCEAVKNQVGERLFSATARGETPALDSLVDDFWQLRLRRMRLAWHSTRLPPVLTHDLVDEAGDEVLGQIRYANLWNTPDDPVKVIYHPDFITSTNPLFGMDYSQFVRGCHLGIFPSHYEPWGYAPMECIASGVPAVTSDVSGFGTYVLENMPDYKDRGLYVVRRRHSDFNTAADALAEWLLAFAGMDRRQRISQRNEVESAGERFDWSHLGVHYAEAHEMALERAGR